MENFAFKCPYCDHKFKNIDYDYYISLLIDEDMNEETIICNECNKKLKLKLYLDVGFNVYK